MFSCGFDSLPFELGVFFCQETAKKVLGAPVTRVKGRIRGMSTTISGGTAASFKATFAAAAKDLSLVAHAAGSVCIDAGLRRPKAAAEATSRCSTRISACGRRPL